MANVACLGLDRLQGNQRPVNQKTFLVGVDPIGISYSEIQKASYTFNFFHPFQSIYL